MPDPILAEVLNLVASEDGLGRIERIRWIKSSARLKQLGATEAGGFERSLTMEYKKRRMLLLPDVNPNSFVFFFERGTSGASWSIRDYSIGNHVRVYRPGDFPWTADEIFQKARYAFNAPTHHTEDLAFWHKHTIELNNKYGANTATSSATLPHRKPETLLRIARNVTILLWSNFKTLVRGLRAEPATTSVE